MNSDTTNTLPTQPDDFDSAACLPQDFYPLVKYHRADNTEGEEEQLKELHEHMEGLLHYEHKSRMDEKQSH